MSLVFNYIYSICLAKAEKDHPLMLLLDEFINFGRIPNMAKKLTMIRHAKVGAVLGIQDYIQLDELYGDKRAKIIFGQPATRVFFRPNDFRTAEEIAKLLGKKTAEDISINGRCEVFSRRLERWLLTPQELLSLDECNLIARVPDHKYPLLINRIPMDYIKEKTDVSIPSMVSHPVLDEHCGPLDEEVPWLSKANEQSKWWNSLKENEKREIFEQEKKRKASESKPSSNEDSSSYNIPNTKPGNQLEFPDVGEMLG